MSSEPENSLIIAVFSKVDSAEYVYNTLLDMQNATMVKVKTVSTVHRNQRGKLKVQHKHGMTTGKGAIGGIAIGLLLGGPILGGAIGALIGSRGGGEQRKARKFLDEKLGENDSGIIVLVEEADWAAVKDLFMRFEAQILQLELTAEAEEELAKLADDGQVSKAVREEIEISENSDRES